MFRPYIALVRERSEGLVLCGGGCVGFVGGAGPTPCPPHHVTKQNTPIHNILLTAPQLSISQKTLGMLREDGNVMPKHVGDTIHT
jgi:hypothetical protein